MRNRHLRPFSRDCGSGQALKGGATRPEIKALLNEKDNLIFNGDFEQSPLKAGFDWRASPQTFLAVDFSAPGAYHGAHCLRVDFTVSRNDEYEPASGKPAGWVSLTRKQGPVSEVMSSERM